MKFSSDVSPPPPPIQTINVGDRNIRTTGTGRGDRALVWDVGRVLRFWVYTARFPMTVTFGRSPVSSSPRLF